MTKFCKMIVLGALTLATPAAASSARGVGSDWNHQRSWCEAERQPPNRPYAPFWFGLPCWIFG